MRGIVANIHLFKKFKQYTHNDMIFISHILTYNTHALKFVYIFVVYFKKMRLFKFFPWVYCYYGVHRSFSLLKNTNKNVKIS